ncbi:MAG: HEAT repeat domain-containing protein [Peptococcaceae bacterium]
MDLSLKMKAFLKTGKLNIYEQAKELVLNEKDNTAVAAALKNLTLEQKEKLLAEEWAAIPAGNRRFVIHSVFLENWHKLFGNFGDLTETEQIKRLEYLGYIQSPEVAGFLLEQMKSKREGVRLTASFALKMQDPQYILKPLLTALTKPQEWLPSRVFEVLKSWGPELNKYLYEMVDQAEGEIQEIIVQVLGETGDDDCLPVFTKLVGNSEDRVKKRIAEALKELKIRQSWPILIKLLEEQEWQTRMLAVQALGQLNIPETIPILAGRKNIEDDDLVKECIDDAIGLIEEASIPTAVSWVRER